MTCICCRNEDRLTSQWRGIELCDECAAFQRERMDPLNMREQAKAVLAFARGPINIKIGDAYVIAVDLTDEARAFVKAQGWEPTE